VIGLVTIDTAQNIYITWSEIAARLGVAQSTARKYETTRGLPVYRIGHLVRLDEAEYQKWEVSERRRRKNRR